MNDESSEFHEELSAPGLSSNKADNQSPGEMLREARLAHDYTIEDLYAQTKLTRKTLQALEENDFDALSQPVFARGYYRQCAKVLDLDADQLVAAYVAFAGEPRTPRPAPPSSVGLIPQDVTPRGRRRFGLLILLVIVLAVIAGVVLLLPSIRMPGSHARHGGNTTVLLSGKPSDSDTGSDSGSAAANGDPAADSNPGAGAEAGQAAKSGGSSGIAAGGTPDIAGNAQPAPTGQTPGGRNVSRTLGMGDAGGTADTKASADTNTPAQADTGAGQDATGGGNAGGQGGTSAPQVPANQLTLRFKKRSWVSVKDANGNRMLSGIYESGDTKTLSGTPPYKVVLGVATGVGVSIGGRKVDVGGQTAGNGTAHLTIAARGSNG